MSDHPDENWVNLAAEEIRSGKRVAFPQMTVRDAICRIYSLTQSAPDLTADLSRMIVFHRSGGLYHFPATGEHVDEPTVIGED